MAFTERWHALLDACDDLPAEATFVTPLTAKRFRITDAQEHRILVQFDPNNADADDRNEGGQTQPLQREQFETLADRITEAAEENGFDLERLPPEAEPYATVLSLHPRYEVNERTGMISETDESTATTSQLVESEDEPSAGSDATTDNQERVEPNLPLYSDALLLIDALERHDPQALDELETPALINLYTLCSDVQRNASDLRQEVSDVLLERVHHDQPVHGQYGSVQRTSRRNRSLKDDEEVLRVLGEAGIPEERVLGVDRQKVDEALEVLELSEGAVYDVDEREYVRKAEVDEQRKETRLQGLKDRLARSDEPETDQLRAEIADLEQRIDDLTEFSPGSEFSAQS
jgi:hypothetical protein